MGKMFHHKVKVYTKQVCSVFIGFLRFEFINSFCRSQEPKIEIARFEGWENTCLKTDHIRTPQKYHI